MSEYKLLAQRISLIGITNILLSLSGIIILPILTKNISIEDYGVWVQINVTIGLIPSVIMLGLPYTMVRFLPSANEEEKKEIFYSILILVIIMGLFVSIFIYTLAGSIAEYLFNNNIIVVKVISLIVFFECMNGMFLNYFRATEQVKKYSTFIFAQTIIHFILVSLFILHGKGIIGAVIGILLKSIVISLTSGFIIISNLEIVIPKFNNLKEYVSFGFPTIPGNLSSWVVNSSDRYVISILLGTAAVGYYSPGYALGDLIKTFVAPISFMLPTILSKYYDTKDTDTVKIILSNSLKFFLALGIPSVFGLTFLSKTLLSILSTPEIASASYLITPFIAVSALFSGIYSIITQIIIMEKRTKMMANIWILSATLNLCLNFLFIPLMGSLGAAVTTLIAFTLNLIITSVYSFRFLKFEIHLDFIVKSIIASIIMSIILIRISPSDIFEVLYTVSLCAIVYFAILRAIKGFNDEEIKFLKGIVRV